MPPKSKVNAKALIRRRKPRTLEYRVCVDPDLVREYEAAVAERDAARSGPRDSLAAGAVPDGLEQRIADLLTQVEANTIPLTFKALSRPEFRALRDAHPPKKDADGNFVRVVDSRLGVDADGFGEPLVRASLVAPELDDDDVTALINEVLTDGQWDDVFTKVWNLNVETVDVPFSPAGSETMPSS
jgi:hypothetical protein